MLANFPNNLPSTENYSMAGNVLLAMLCNFSLVALSMPFGTSAGNPLERQMAPQPHPGQNGLSESSLRSVGLMSYKKDPDGTEKSFNSKVIIGG